jgi:predicted nucleic acid-binding protein
VIFVDTSAWYAGYAAADAHHHAAKKFHLECDDLFVTTDYVVDETLTLFKARGNYEQAFALGRQLFSEQLARLIRVSVQDVDAAWQVFNSHRDKEWSFTDSVSYVVMKELGINDAFAFDEHFAQFGFVNVRP